MITQKYNEKIRDTIRTVLERHMSKKEAGFVTANIMLILDAEILWRLSSDPDNTTK